MEFGTYTLQIVVSVIVVLGAAFVALIVDFLKGNNEQLRELAIELKARRDEPRREQTMIPQRVTAPTVPLEQISKIESAKVEAKVENDRPEKRVPTQATRSTAAPREKKRMPSPAAMAAMERGAKLAASPQGQREAAQRMAKAAAPASPEIVVERRPEPVPATIVEMKAAPAQKKDWNSLLARRTQKEAVPAEVAANRDLLQAVVAETNSQRGQEDTLPAGFHAGYQDGYILSHLVQNRRPVTGLVVSIGVNATRNADNTMPEPVCALIQSLIGPDDFACQSSPEEFLLIYPGHRGASAQRKLSQIAQQLWDFQLRSLGTFQILFSWGGVEVRSESIEEAISAANERMQETRRGRKLLTMESRNEMPLRKAV